MMVSKHFGHVLLHAADVESSLIHSMVAKRKNVYSRRKILPFILNPNQVKGQSQLTKR